MSPYIIIGGAGAATSKGKKGRGKGVVQKQQGKEKCNSKAPAKRNNNRGGRGGTKAKKFQSALDSFGENDDD